MNLVIGLVVARSCHVGAKRLRHAAHDLVVLCAASKAALDRSRWGQPHLRRCAQDDFLETNRVYLVSPAKKDLALSLVARMHPNAIHGSERRPAYTRMPCIRILYCSTSRILAKPSIPHAAIHGLQSIHQTE